MCPRCARFMRTALEDLDVPFAERDDLALLAISTPDGWRSPVAAA